MITQTKTQPRINAYRRRILAALRPLLAPHAPFSRALDFGSGDGLFAKIFADEQLAEEVVPVDVQPRETCCVEPVLYDGGRLPFDDRSFELTYAMDVLHHCDDPRSGLKELARCSSNYVLIKDHTHRTSAGKWTLSLMDEIGNRRFGIPCLYNYQRGWEWTAWLAEEGFVLDQRIHPAACHVGPIGRMLNRLEFIAALETRNDMNESGGHDRLFPRIWNHQWYPLMSLRRGMQEVFRRHAVPTSGQTVVDIGCGDRPYESVFREMGCNYIGCDLSDDADVVLRPGQPIDLPDRSADGIVSIQVLEHVWDLDWYLAECRRILKPDGWMLLSTHGTWLYHPHPTDFRRWTRDGLVRELQTRGFDVKTVVAKVGPLAWTSQFRLLGFRHLFQRLPIVGSWLASLFSCVMNLRMVVEEAFTPASIRDSNASVYVTLSHPSECL